MDEDSAFIQAIVANPHDPYRWLVYADWLEEHGDSRSEFLRLECALATLWHEVSAGKDQFRPQVELLRAQARKLRSAISPAWLARIQEARRQLQRGIIRCCACQQPLAADEAIALNPITQLKLKGKRYCQDCWEEAVRSHFHRYADLAAPWVEEHWYNYYGTARDDV